MRTPKIYLDALPWDVRSRNTDWRYIRHGLAKMAAVEPDLEFIAPRSIAVTLRGNGKAIAAAMLRRIGLPMSQQRFWTHRLAAGELRRSGANLVFAGSYPRNAGSVPVVWVNAIIDPAMQLTGPYGVSAKTLEEEIEVKRPLFQRAARVQMYSEAEVARHRKSFPESADRFFAAPWFTGNLHACDEALLDRHRGANPVRVLFVGNNALRKGLPQLLEAFTKLPTPVLSKTRLTVISNFDRSPMSVPEHPSVTVLRGASGEVVLQHMRRSHILANVAHFESLGVVFLEAMAQGMVCLGPRWEVQRELFQGETAGLNIACDATAIRIALERLIEDEELRSTMARAAWLRFQRCYAPAVSAARYRELFFQALEAAT